MRKLKIFLAVIFMGILGLLGYENRELFCQWYSFDFNLFIYEYRTPEVIVGVYFMAVFLMGFLIAYFSGLMDQYRLRRTIRGLEKQLAALKKGTLVPKAGKEDNASGAAPGGDEAKAVSGEPRPGSCS